MSTHSVTHQHQHHHQQPSGLLTGPHHIQCRLTTLCSLEQVPTSPPAAAKQLAEALSMQSCVAAFAHKPPSIHASRMLVCTVCRAEAPCHSVQQAYAHLFNMPCVENSHLYTSCVLPPSCMCVCWHVFVGLQDAAASGCRSCLHQPQAAPLLLRSGHAVRSSVSTWMFWAGVWGWVSSCAAPEPCMNSVCWLLYALLFAEQT